MSKETVIKKTTKFVKEALSGFEVGHDWWHVYRVWKSTIHIAKTENIDLFVAELGALLHDIADSKFHSGDESVGPRKARDFLDSLSVDVVTTDHVVKIIENISFKGGNHVQKFTSPELDVVQDADRLEAIGAIGIARAFTYGGHHNDEIHNPNIKPRLGMTKKEYKKNTPTTINHFYEKLLSLKDMMNTKSGSKLANARHEYMEQFLSQFYAEWEGKK